METGITPGIQHYAIHLLKYWEDDNGNRTLPFGTILHTALCLGQVSHVVHKEYGMIGPKERPVDTLIDTMLECLRILASPHLQWTMDDNLRFTPVSPYDEGTYEQCVFDATFTFIEKYL